MGNSSSARTREAPEIRMLRQRYVLVAAASAALVISVVLAVTNIMNWNSMTNSLDMIVEQIVAEGGELSVDEAGAASLAVSIDEGTLDDDGGLDPAAPIEVPYSIRYFTVTLDEAGEAVGANTDHVVSVSRAQALALGEQAAASHARHGYLNDFRYAVTRVNGERTAVFLSARGEVASYWSFFASSLTAGVLGLCLVVGLAVPLARRAVAPLVESQAAQRRFVTDASHEIRTPLAVILSTADVIELEQGESPWLDAIRKQVARLDDLAGKLVFLSRNDEGGLSMPLGRVDLVELVHERLHHAEARIAHAGVECRLELPARAAVRGDRERLAQLLDLLIDNALRHGDASQPWLLAIEAPAESDRVRFQLRNAADNLTAGLHDELFERFYRADAARSSEGGHGIGLAVARAIVSAHQGDIQAVSDDGASLRVAVWLPAWQDADGEGEGGR
ncbi:HAMP domain-containing histidine kinase [Eggerthellaceae bacterium zg-1084]|uniref:sensor histidine kinase n=1 Tax=Berryella wangjianweii TaxID=2734634 RepID=UPI001557CE9C|nr:HAMP domain-containing sensor histidine kinase [Berryella wangjianweii]NPD30735.1 HAMP domain-containing histidine kinase [Berryella wangjianweii]